jgi:hypothetical protein
MRPVLIAAAVMCVGGIGVSVRADELRALPVVQDVERQPLAAHVRRVAEALQFLGAPLAEPDHAALQKALQEPDAATAIAAMQQVLDAYCLLAVDLDAEGKPTMSLGPAPQRLVEHGWTQFLVKVYNPHGLKKPLRARSPNAQRLAGSPAEDVASRWLDLQTFDQQPLLPALSGLALEYRPIQLYSRDVGDRQALLAMDYIVRESTQPAGRTDAARRPEDAEVIQRARPIEVSFECLPSHEVTFEVMDENGKPATAAFVIRDARGQVYPSQAKRLAPDFAFHPQIYRSHGETIKLPWGQFTVVCSRGPESVPQSQTVKVGDGPATIRYQVRRWIDPVKFGWYSGDHHIHAAGCAHYSNPTQGVHAEDMIRHCLGEDLKVGCNLTWGPCFDYQLQFFTGKDDPVSRYPYLLRYDIEVSGFGSHRSGHLCLLRLTERNYPGGESNAHWPTLGLNTLRWAKRQGAITGPAHSGSGLAPSSQRVADTDGPNKLPNYAIPQYNGIGANEYIVDITHEVPGPDGRPVPAVDFISTMDTNRNQELNMWYHTLNCGFRVRASGETDFPCISGARVGIGRVYVRVEGQLNYEDWCEGIREGRSYVSDGTSHLMDFTVSAGEQQVAVGRQGSQLDLEKPGTVRVAAQVAVRQDDARIPVELIVNAYPQASREIVADGSLQEIAFEVPIDQSSWVALRTFPSAHTNPVFVIVDEQPIRASRRSAQWCLEGVDQCWAEKQKTYDADEMEDARAAYDHARRVYARILSESKTE